MELTVYSQIVLKYLYANQFTLPETEGWILNGAE